MQYPCFEICVIEASLFLPLFGSSRKRRSTFWPHSLPRLTVLMLPTYRFYIVKVKL